MSGETIIEGAFEGTVEAVPEEGWDKVLDAQKRLMRQRRAAGIDLDTGRAKLVVPPTDARMTVAMSPLPLGLVSGDDLMPPPGNYHCMVKLPSGEPCRAKISLPGVCSGCAEREEATARETRKRELLERSIPKKFRGATWATLPTMKNKAGTGPLVAIPSARFEVIRRTLETKNPAVLVGPTGAGKSFLAAAYIHEALDRGSERARFISAVELDDAERGRMVYDLAMGAEFLVLDDLGAEIHGAPAEGGIISQRIKLVSTLLQLRYNDDARIVITTPHETKKLEEIYGDGNVRKVFDDAGIERIGTVEPLRGRAPERRR